MGDFLQLIVSGTATGAIYALAALGFTLLWQAAGVINFAQGEFVMLPAFAMLFFIAVGRAAVARVPARPARSPMLVLGYGFKRVHRRSADQARRDSARDRDARPVDRASSRSCAPATAPRRTRSRARSPTGQFALAGINVSYADIGTLVLARRDRRRRCRRS